MAYGRRELFYHCDILHTNIFYKNPPGMAKRTHKNNMVAKQTEATFATNFRKAREIAGLRQQDIVDKTRLTQTFISRIEGKKQSPSLGNAVVLAEAVGEPLCTLLRLEK